MQNIKLLGIICTLLIFISCKKTEMERVAPQAENGNTVSADATAWSTADTWTNTGSTYHASIKADNITADIINSGMVLLFVKGSNTPQSLPAHIGKASWFYQAEEGTIGINAVTDDQSAFDKDQSFTYLLFSSEQLASLEKEGYSKSTLVGLDYTTLAGLIHKN